MPDPFPSPSVDDASTLVGRRILSGTGEELGVIVSVEPDRFGRPKKLVFIEEGSGAQRFVPLRFVRDVDGGVVKLAGPREGYHITRVAVATRFGPGPGPGPGDDDSGRFGTAGERLE